MLVVEGPSGNGIGRSVAPLLGCDFVESRHALFPDGESEVGIVGLVKGNDLLLVQSTYPMQDKRLVELLLLADCAKKHGARSIGAIIPYLAYMRQDRLFEGKGNAVSINAVLEMLSFAGVTSLITVAPHNFESLSAFKGSVTVVDAAVPLAEEVKKDVENPFVLAPDEGAMDLARRFAEVLGCDYAYIEKRRDKQTGEVDILKEPKADLKGKEVIVVDDMISTGGTIAQAAKFAHSGGASSVIAAAAHLLMVSNAYDRIKEAGINAIYGTNTVPYGRAHMVDISDAVAAAIRGAAKKRMQGIDTEANRL